MASVSLRGLGEKSFRMSCRGIENFRELYLQEKASDIIDHISENAVIDCSADLLHDDPFNKVAGVERLKRFIEDRSLSSNDGDGTDEWVVGGDTGVDHCVEDEAEVSLSAAGTEGGWDGLAVCFAFHF
jgi:hypothetical protein